MTLQETAKIVYVIKATYPAHFSKYTTKDYDNMIQAWTTVMEDYTYMQASAGLKIYLASDTKGFPPSPGQVIDCLSKHLGDQTLELTNTECVSMIRRALRNSSYHAEDEYNKLPEICQRAVGTPRNLQEWAVLNSDEVETVVMSQIIRSLEAMRRRMKDDARLPGQIKKMIDAKGGRPKIEEHNTDG